DADLRTCFQDSPMFVPPRLVAGWLLAGAAVCAGFWPSAAQAQTSAGRMAPPGTNINTLRSGDVSWQGSSNASQRTARANYAYYGPGSRAYVPRHLRGVEASFSEVPGEIIAGPTVVGGDGHVIPEGATIIEGEPGDITFEPIPGGSSCCDGGCSGSCGGSGCDTCSECGQVQCCCCCI